MAQKRVLTIQDISCLGKCSLTAAIPVLSVMGLETVALPTAVFSTHTAFPGAVARDLTDMLLPFAEHWREQEITFDSMSCGYLGSVVQMELIRRIFEEFKKPGTLTLVDPVMGDNGRLYSGFDEEYVRRMRQFISSADVLLPNLTEAACLLEMEYAALPADRAGYEQIARELSERSGASVLLKGISLKEGRIAVLVCEAKTKQISFCERNRLDAALSGTGDIFTAVCQGGLTLGYSLVETAELAMDFVLECMERTLADSGHRWYGVNLEEALLWLGGALHGTL